MADKIFHGDLGQLTVHLNTQLNDKMMCLKDYTKVYLAFWNDLEGTATHF
jgi:hypothetical protein